MQQIHPVFHAGLLEKYGVNGSLQPPLVLKLIDDAFGYTIDAILDHREVKLIWVIYRKRKVKDLVHWLGHGNKYNTFEPAVNLANSSEAVQEYWLKQPPDHENWVTAKPPKMGLL